MLKREKKENLIQKESDFIKNTTINKNFGARKKINLNFSLFWYKFPKRMGWNEKRVKQMI